MKAPSVKFNTKERPEFYREVRKRVNKHFKENNLSRYANFSMKFKTLFMLSLYTAPLVLIIVGVIPSFWLLLVMCALMGFGMAGIGLSIMHDANHGSYSRNQTVNNVLGYLLNYIGGYHLNWKIQHNLLHHSYTNVEGFDEDIDAPIMRLSPNRERKGIHRYQAFYAPLIYGIMTLYWISTKDFGQLKRYDRKNLLASQKRSFKNALTELIVNKIWYAGIALALPIIFSGLPWWQILIGFVVMHMICGLVLALIFQTAHVIEETEFFVPDENSSVENTWAIHQMRTTANFADRSLIFSWLIGGLNYQIEHHLFPNICHVHYKRISKIVRATAEEFNVPYHRHKTFFGALKSHFSLLHRLGTGQTDRQIAGA